MFACVFAGSFQYGYNISSANGPATFIKDTFYPLSFEEGVYENGQLVPNCTSVDECAPCQTSNCTWGFDPSKQAEVDLEIAARGNRFLFLPPLICVLENKYAFQVGIFAVGGITGSFLVKTLITKFGRKGSQAKGHKIWFWRPLFGIITRHGP